MIRMLPTTIALVLLVAACHTVAKPAAYGAELAECSRTAETCEQSIACENETRARYGRPLRDATKGCK